MQSDGRGAKEKQRDTEMRAKRCALLGLTVGMVHKRWHVRERGEEGEGGGDRVREQIRRQGTDEGGNKGEGYSQVLGGCTTTLLSSALFTSSSSPPSHALLLRLPMLMCVTCAPVSPLFPTLSSPAHWCLFCTFWTLSSFCLPPVVDLLSRAAPSPTAHLRRTERHAVQHTAFSHSLPPTRSLLLSIQFHSTCPSPSHSFFSPVSL